jgi:hypothetical protein
MTSKERMLAALTGGRPDRLPVTTHHVMPYFLSDRTLAKLPSDLQKVVLDTFRAIPHVREVRRIRL